MKKLLSIMCAAAGLGFGPAVSDARAADPSWKCVVTERKIGAQAEVVHTFNGPKFPSIGESVTMTESFRGRRVAANSDFDENPGALTPDQQEELDRRMGIPTSGISCKFAYDDRGDLHFNTIMEIVRPDPRTDRPTVYRGKPDKPNADDLKLAGKNPVQVTSVFVKALVNDGMGASNIETVAEYRSVCWAENAPVIKESTAAEDILNNALGQANVKKDPPSAAVSTYTRKPGSSPTAQVKGGRPSAGGADAQAVDGALKGKSSH